MTLERIYFQPPPPDDPRGHWMPPAARVYLSTTTPTGARYLAGFENHNEASVVGALLKRHHHHTGPVIGSSQPRPSRADTYWADTLADLTTEPS